MYIVDVFDKIWPEADSVNKIIDRSITYLEPLNEWAYEKFNYVDINQYQKLSEGTIYLGEIWDTDGTYFFTRDVHLPATCQETDWYIAFDIGGECEVYVDGVAFGSLDNEHHEVLVAEKSTKSRTISIKIQATKHVHNYVRTKRVSGIEYSTHIFKSAHLISKSKILTDFGYTALSVLDLLQCDYLEKHVRDELHEILKVALYKIDYFVNIDTLESQIIVAQQQLLHAINQLKVDKNFGHSLFMGHSHLDLAFKWQYHETYRKIERTLSNTVCLMDRYPNVTYTQSQMHIFETLSKGYPQLFERVKKHIANGKLEAVGDIYVEFDTNIPSGESLIRQIVIGKNIANNLLGTNSNVCFLPDTFGYSGILPQLLKQAGFEYFVTSKLSWNDTNPPLNLSFLWRGIDGSGIKTHLIESYGGHARFTRINERCKDERCKSMPHSDCQIYQYGAGDGGGGINESSILTIQANEKLKPFGTIHQTTLEQALDMLFENVDISTLPIRNGELYFENHRGVYTSQEKIKKGNRKLELALQRLESLNTLSHLLGVPYYQDKINKIWKKLLLNQFHDIIAGSCVGGVVVDADKDYKNCIEECSKISNEILEQLTISKNYISVINPLGFDTNGLVEIDLPHPTNEIDGHFVQMLPTSNGKYRGLIKIDCVAAFGHKHINISNEKIKQAQIVPHKNTPSNILENSKYLIEFDEKGEIIQLFDKLQQRQVLRNKGNMLCAHVDRSGYFESWNITEDIERKIYHIDNVEYMELIEGGPLRKTIRIQKSFKNSIITQDISIYEDLPRIDFKTTADFNEQQMLLKAWFDVDVDYPFATYDISMGNIERETTRNNSFEKAKFEVNMHKFVDLSSHDYGVAILNDCKYGCDVKGGRMRITLIKTATFPDTNQDIGHHEFCYSLYPHSGNAADANVRQHAYQLNQPLYAFAGRINLPERPICCSDSGIIIETLKKAENSNDIIVRLYDHHGYERDIKIYFNIDFSNVKKCNILENEISEDIQKNDTEICFKIKPYEIVTLKLEM